MNRRSTRGWREGMRATDPPPYFPETFRLCKPGTGLAVTIGIGLAAAPPASLPGQDHKEPMMGRPGVFKPIALTALGLALLSAAAVGILFGMPMLKNLYAPANGAEPKPAENTPAGVVLADGTANTVDVKHEVAEKLKIHTLPVEVARPRLLELPGSLAVDPQAQARIRTRFPGEVVEIEQMDDPIARQKQGYTVKRSLAPGDEVKQGQRLAVVWSKDLGEKKSELVDGLSALALDRDTLKRFEDGLAKGIIPEQR